MQLRQLIQQILRLGTITATLQIRQYSNITKKNNIINNSIQQQHK